MRPVINFPSYKVLSPPSPNRHALRPSGNYTDIICFLIHIVALLQVSTCVNCTSKAHYSYGARMRLLVSLYVFLLSGRFKCN